MNTAQIHIDSLERFGDYTSLYCEGKAYASAQQMRRGCVLAAILRDHGAGPGDNVVVMMPNSPDVGAAFHAIWRIGAVCLPVTPQLGPREALLQHPAIAEAAVIGVPDNTFGENICAVIATRPGKTATEEEIKAHTANCVTKFKIPARVVFLPELPKSHTGKILKKDLRRMMEQAPMEPVARLGE